MLQLSAMARLGLEHLGLLDIPPVFEQVFNMANVRFDVIIFAGENRSGQ